MLSPERTARGLATGAMLQPFPEDGASPLPESPRLVLDGAQGWHRRRRLEQLLLVPFVSLVNARHLRGQQAQASVRSSRRGHVDGDSASSSLACFQSSVCIERSSTQERFRAVGHTVTRVWTPDCNGGSLRAAPQSTVSPFPWELPCVPAVTAPDFSAIALAEAAVQAHV